MDTNPSQLGQVILNLLKNSSESAPNIEVVIKKEYRDGKVFVAIEDTGPGIPEEIQTKIFDPFFTTKAQGEGTGLGLYLCKDIMKNLGGDIIAVNHVDKGVTFVLTIPAPLKTPIPHNPHP